MSLKSPSDNADPAASEFLVLSSIENFYIGGQTRDVQTGTFGLQTQVRGQMYVEHYGPAGRSFPVPLIFIHGAVHTGAVWGTTPDGREGWRNIFLREGFDCYLVDQPWRGRSAPDLSALNPTLGQSEIAPEAFACGLQVVDFFVRGGTRFPLEAKRDYAAQFWPDFGLPAAARDGRLGLSDPRSLPPLLDLIDRLGTAILIVHSQAAHIGWLAALERPKSILAIHAIEPALTIPGLDDPRFPDIPVRITWGDHLDETADILNLNDVRIAKSIAAERANVELDWLPEAGITGNGHMLMMEDNNVELAQRSIDWLRSLRLDVD